MYGLLNLSLSMNILSRQISCVINTKQWTYGCSLLVTFGICKCHNMVTQPHFKKALKQNAGLSGSAALVDILCVVVRDDLTPLTGLLWSNSCICF